VQVAQVIVLAEEAGFAVVAALDDVEGNTVEMHARAAGHAVDASKKSSLAPLAMHMFQLTDQEFARLRSQFVTSNAGRGGRRYAPYAFTEQGVAMLSSVLRSPRAIAVNVEIMRAFVRLREMVATNTQLARKLEELEARIEKRLTTHDQAIAGILEAIRELMRAPETKKRPIGFVAPQEKKPGGPSSTRDG
jgi:hypothetical protein